MAVDDMYRLTVSATGQGSIYQNVLGLRVVNENPVTSAMFANLADDWLDVWTPVQQNTIVYTQWEALQLWGTGMTIVAGECRREGGQSFGDALTRTGVLSSGDSLPPQCAAVVTWLTGFAGRRRRGRTYAFGQVEANQSDGTWISGWTTGMTTRLNTFMAMYKNPSGTSPDFQLAVWSERTASGCVPATKPAKGHVQVDVPQPALASTPITGYLLRPTVYSQRRRTRGVGR